MKPSVSSRLPTFLACWSSRSDRNDHSRARGGVIVVAAGLALIAVLGCQSRPEPPPNVVLIVIDALRWDHLSTYGYPRPTTPFLDSLAREGWVFDRAYAQASQTFASTATMLTSRWFPDTERARHEPAAAPSPRRRVQYLSQTNDTLAEILSNQGYETIAIFTNPHHHSQSGFWQGFELPVYLDAGRRSPYAEGPRVYEAFFDVFEARDPGRPYFAYLHFMDVHSPYRPPRVFRRLFGVSKGTDHYVNGVPKETPSAADIQFMTDLYDGEIRFLDGVLRDLVAELRRRDPNGRTLFVIASDHGDEFMEHGGLGHGRTLHAEVLRVPLIFAGLEALEPHRASYLVRNLDIVPTILDLCGVAVPEGLDGTSLVPTILGAATAPTESLAWVGRRRSLTTDRWHLTWDRRLDKKSLFDLHSDAEEQIDLATERPRRVAALTRRIRQIEEAAAKRSTSGETKSAPAIDEKILRQLERLGYL